MIDIKFPIAPMAAARTRSTKDGRVYMNPKYAQYQKALQEAFIDYLRQFHGEPITELFGVDENGDPYETMRTTNYTRRPDGSLAGRLRPDFLGLRVQIWFVMKANKEYSPGAFGRNSGDVDNLYKGVTDAIFQTEIMKQMGFDDSLVQEALISKRRLDPDLEADKTPYIRIRIQRKEVPFAGVMPGKYVFTAFNEAGEEVEEITTEGVELTQFLDENQNSNYYYQWQKVW